ncbi:hypothetical protein B0H13DRAFT_2353165 [Mycena leptocephala]|jgi:hypothetical protein|nr:hypothetical protein B0H13DRAFT_2353165 [Mycena leptocephala]
MQSESQITSSSDDPSTRLQMYILRQIGPILFVRPMKRLLDLHDIRYTDTDNIRKLRSHLHSFLNRLDRGNSEDEPSVAGSARHARRTEIKRLRAEWPQVIPDKLKRRLVREFNLQISAENLATFACGSCNELCPIAQKKTIALDQFDINLLKRPDYNDSDDSEMEIDSDDDSSQTDQPPKIKPWLDRRYPEPPMPMDKTPYSSLLSELEGDTDSLAPVLVVCRDCHRDLKANKVPPLSTTNHNYLGPVPPELKDLTVVEEAMISLCRAKCWIIQLRDEDSETSVPIAQRAVHGHIIIYPQKPTAIAKTLPPPIADIITPICVIFVGSKPPTPEWLKEKVKPMIVRKEKVQNALRWLKLNNHLYADIPIDQRALDELPSKRYIAFSHPTHHTEHWHQLFNF